MFVGESWLLVRERVQPREVIFQTGRHQSILVLLFFSTVIPSILILLLQKGHKDKAQHHDVRGGTNEIGRGLLDVGRKKSVLFE